jgi:hypothetical protein
MRKTVTIHNAKTTPPIVDRSLVIGWRTEFPIPKLLEWRKKRAGFYSFAMAYDIDVYCYLADLAGSAGAIAVRERWNERDKK